MIRVGFAASAMVALLLAESATAQGVKCERFSKLNPDAQAAYTWGLVDGATALRASFQIDAIALREEGAVDAATKSDFVAEAVIEKTRPALHRAPADLTKAVAQRCLEVGGEFAILPFLETLDRWRRQPAPEGQATPPR